MKRVLMSFQRSIEAVIGRVQRRFQRSRSGTILIMVVALLVLLALMGTAFIATARLDRGATGQLKQLTSWQEIADGLALQALSIASNWIVIDPQTFTSHTVDTADGAAAGNSIYSARDPVIYGPGTDKLMDNAASTLAVKTPNTKPGSAFIAWPHITQPIGYKYFISPIVPALAPVTASPYGTNTFDLGPLAFMMVPSNVVISYPVGYLFNADLAGRTWTFPAFYRLSQTSGSTTATPSWQVDGPFLAADATGWGIADSALVPLNMPATNGISWFAAWRIVDDAAAVNVNTAFSPRGDEDGFPGAADKIPNCNNYFPSDVNLFGMLYSQFNVAPPTSPPPEFAAINYRRYQIYSTSGSLQGTSGFDDAGVTHNDMQFSNDGEAFWTNLGRRVNYPAAFTTPANNPGDPLKQFQRPLDASDTGAIGYRGVMAQSDGPASKFEQLEANRSAATPPPGNQQGDSVYGSAVNYMANTNNQFKFFEPNQVAYWYDWNFNYDFPYDFTAKHSTGGTSGLPIFNGPSTVSALSTLTIGSTLGTVADVQNPYPFRTPRADLAGTTAVMNQVRTVDPATVIKIAAGIGTSAIPPLTSNIPHKACLNTALFGELWRAYINVFNNFPSQDGTSTFPAAITAANGYYNSLNVPGGTSDPINATIACNPAQFRSVMRDPKVTTSVSANGSSPQNGSTLAMPGVDMLALRAACGAANILTLRDQHGLTSGSYFFPRRSKQTITLTPPTPSPTGPSSYTVNVYGVSAQPFITEVYVSNDTSVHADQTPTTDNGTNPQGLVVIKLYNPYPFAIPLTGYGIALVDRTNFAGGAMNVQMMDLSTVTLPSILANSYLILANFKPGTSYWPSYLGASPDTNPTTYAEVDNLSQAIGGAGVGAVVLSGNKACELLLLAPTDPSNPGLPEAPIDSYDFSGFPVPGAAGATGFTAWHYLRMSGNTTPGSVGAINPNWKCVYPGPYSGTGFPAGAGNPHYQTDVDGPWIPPTPDPWAALIEKNFHLDTVNSYDSQTTTNLLTTPPNSNPYPGIQLCNVDFGGYNKAGTPQYPTTGGKAQFPFGGFARVGDAVQAPFIGSYVISAGSTINWPPPAAGPQVTPVTVAEVNPVTVDTCFADDGDATDDTQEQIGRCVPILGSTASGIDDYSMSGYYSLSNFLSNPANEPSATFQNILPANWRYHFALELLNQFTAVSNPESDYLPNMEPGSWNGNVAPYPVSNTTATAVAAGTPVANDNANKNGSEDGIGVEGTINVNTASWRVLASVELIPRSQDPSGVLNEHLAQAIVHYRDVDDGVTRYASVTPPASVGAPWMPGSPPLTPRGHGPFNSLLELNQVFDYTTPLATTTTIPIDGRRIYPNTFQNAFGTLPAPAQLATEAVRHQWGYYTPGPLQTNTGNLQSDDWVQQYLMVNRVSNMLTTRSDTFTVYVVVQGWRNVTTANSTAAPGTLPELVVQRRMAMTVDRTGLVHNAGTPKTVQLTTK